MTHGIRVFEFSPEPGCLFQSMGPGRVAMAAGIPFFPVAVCCQDPPISFRAYQKPTGRVALFIKGRQ